MGASPDRELQQATLGLNLYLPCFGLALVTLLLFEDSDLQRRWVLFAVPVVLFGFAPLLGRFFEDHPRKCAVGTALAMIGLGWMGAAGFGTAFLLRTLYFYSCALGSVWIHKYLRGPEYFRKVELERFVAVPLGLVMLFSVFVYGHVKPRFGGGAPIPVLLHLGPDAAGILGGEAVSCWLVEQTDYAIYILRSREGNKAVLLPRDSVRAIEFNSSEQATVQPKKQ